MHLVYSLFLTLAFVLALPWFLWQAFINRKYLDNLRDRLGILPDLFGQESAGDDARPGIWIHAVSVGEAMAAGPLIRQLRQRFPGRRIIVSTTTATGQTVARSRLTEADAFCYFPFDWRFSVRRALDRIRPECVILMESELWPRFLHECKLRDIPVLVANGRISDRSFPRAARFGALTRRLYRLVTHFAMQSPVDAERARQLGAPAARVSVSGNLKYDIGGAQDNAQMPEHIRDLAAAMALDAAPLIIAGSSCDGEEEMILAAFARLRGEAELADTRLLIAPRHPQRFDEIARLLESSGFRWVRRSDYKLAPALAGAGMALRSPAPLPRETSASAMATADVILLDSIGELATLFPLASVVFIGGSLVPRGGHNVLEPALHARPVVVGPHMENFRDIALEFTRRDAMVMLAGNNETALTRALCATWQELLTNPARARQLGENARQVVIDNRGATTRTVEIAAALMTEAGRQ